MKQKLCYVLLFLFLAVSIVFSIPNLVLVSDETVNSLLLGTLSRVGLFGFSVVLLLLYRGLDVLRFPVKTLGKSLMWCLPCLLVAVGNFPFSALIRGTATVSASWGTWVLFLAECLAIGLSEELLFRGILHVSINGSFQTKKNGYFWAVVASSALFGGWHLLNLLSGAGIAATLLQVGYSFLIGAMLAVVLDKTENLWLCVFLHALFDVGGTLIEQLGSGDPHDLVFWILTAVFGVLCAVWIVREVLLKNKAQNRNLS